MAVAITTITGSTLPGMVVALIMRPVVVKTVSSIIEKHTTKTLTKKE